MIEDPRSLGESEIRVELEPIGSSRNRMAVWHTIQSYFVTVLAAVCHGFRQCVAFNDTMHRFLRRSSLLNEGGTENVISFTMKKSLKTTSRSTSPTLGDLIVALASSSRNTREVAAALADLCNSGQVSLSNQRRRLRVV